MLATGVLTFILFLAIALLWRQLGKVALVLGLVTGMALGATLSEPVITTVDKLIGSGVQATAKIGR